MAVVAEVKVVCMEVKCNISGNSVVVVIVVIVEEKMKVIRSRFYCD